MTTPPATDAPEPAQFVSARASVPTHTQELPRVVDDEPAVVVYRPRRRGSTALGGMVLLLALVLIVVGTAITTYALGLWSRQEDPGAVACRTMLTAFQADAQVDPAVYRLLQESRDPNLRISGAAFERFLALPEEDRRERLAGLSDLITAVGNLGVGCEAVGVHLPPEMLQAEPA